MKNKLIILALALSALGFSTAGCKEVNIDGTGKDIKKHNRAMPVINVTMRAIRQGIAWCHTSGGLKSITIDPNQGYLYRYICRHPKHTIDAGYENH